MTEADKKKLDRITEQILKQIDEKGFQQTGAFNLRHNGIALCHGDSEHIKIRKKEDKPGIDVYIDGDTKGEQVHIPVVVDASGMTDIVYNDFYIAEGADVTIIAGCGIHNSGCNESRHDGIHSFHVGKGANVRYEEKHYGEGEGTGARVLNPVTRIFLEDDAVFTLDTVQIKGVDSTRRETEVSLGAGAKTVCAGETDDSRRSDGRVQYGSGTERGGQQRPDHFPVCGKGRVYPDFPPTGDRKDSLPCAHPV